jgi:hypothetical protein
MLWRSFQNSLSLSLSLSDVHYIQKFEHEITVYPQIFDVILKTLKFSAHPTENINKISKMSRKQPYEFSWAIKNFNVHAAYSSVFKCDEEKIVL